MSLLFSALYTKCPYYLVLDMQSVLIYSALYAKRPYYVVLYAKCPCYVVLIYICKPFLLRSAWQTAKRPLCKALKWQPRASVFVSSPVHPQGAAKGVLSGGPCAPTTARRAVRWTAAWPPAAQSRPPARGGAPTQISARRHKMTPVKLNMPRSW